MGLMQTIGPTFNAYKLPGHDQILNPLDNILAGLRYIIGRYGSIFNVQQAVGSTPRGYDTGGRLPPGLSLAWNGTGRYEHVTTDDTMTKVVKRLEDLIRVNEKVAREVSKVAPGVGQEITGAVRSTRQLSRTL